MAHSGPVIAAVDTNRLNIDIVFAANKLARITDRSVKVVNVVEPLLETYADLDFSPLAEVSTQWAISALRANKQICEQLLLSHNIEDVSVEVVTGKITTTLAKYVQQQQAPLLVMGARGRHGIMHAMGSTTQRMVSLGLVDILSSNSTNNATNLSTMLPASSVKKHALNSAVANRTESDTHSTNDSVNLPASTRPQTSAASIPESTPESVPDATPEVISDAQDNSLNHYTNVLVAVDSTEEAEGVLQRYQAYIDPRYTQCRILTVAQPLSATYLVYSKHFQESNWGVGALDRDIAARTLAHAECSAVRAGLDKSQVELRVGDPAEQILSEAQHMNADLVVVGAGSKSTLSQIALGSTARSILNRCACDVLVLAP